MKKLILGFVFLMFCAASSVVFADKITISGQPVVVEQQGDIYVPATTVTTKQDYYYVTMGGSQRVCYREAQPTLASVNSGLFSFRIGGSTVQVRCYDYSPDYFVVQ